MKIQITLIGNELHIQTLLQKNTTQYKTFTGAYQRIIQALILDLKDLLLVTSNEEFKPAIYMEEKSIEIIFNHFELTVKTPLQNYNGYCTELKSAYVIIIHTLIKDLILKTTEDASSYINFGI